MLKIQQQSSEKINNLQQLLQNQSQQIEELKKQLQESVNHQSQNQIELRSDLRNIRLTQQRVHSQSTPTSPNLPTPLMGPTMADKIRSSLTPSNTASPSNSPNYFKSFPLKVVLTEKFKSPLALRQNLLNSFEEQHDLPKITSIYLTEKLDAHQSTNTFKFIFDNNEWRSKWIKALRQNDITQNLQTLGTRFPKVKIHGLSEHAANHYDQSLTLLAKLWNAPLDHIHFLFKYKNQLADKDSWSFAIMVHPNLRRKIFKNKDRANIIFEEDQMTLNIEDYHTPCQCAKCGKFGHSAKICKANENVLQHCQNCGQMKCQKTCESFKQLTRESSAFTNFVCFEMPPYYFD
jgi:hypothetical protein